MSGAPQAWYQLAEARAVLRCCAERQPDLIRGEQKFVRTTDVWWSFDRDDARVARLDQIMTQHLAPLFENRSSSDALRAAGVLVSVDMAIDAVLPAPRAGNSGNPAYVESLPVIDLALGRAVA